MLEYIVVYEIFLHTLNSDAQVNHYKAEFILIQTVNAGIEGNPDQLPCSSEVETSR